MYRRYARFETVGCIILKSLRVLIFILYLLQIIISNFKTFFYFNFLAVENYLRHQVLN